ncbi:MAG: DNA mismatch repair endonuclease MutL [Chitinispirillia bacterium]
MTQELKSKIQLLSKSVIEKIAAGEVIERPASVVKEIVENSLDSGASKIDIIVEDGGYSLIRVIDNGSGMDIDDIKKCLLRHSTSKISSSDDLFSIVTMGFRGEALASIAAVSRFSLNSCPSNDGLGYSIYTEGGDSSDIKPVSHIKGTTVTCKDLFYNVPARKKFMKSQKAERMAIVRLLEHLSISFPSVHFCLTIDGSLCFHVPRVDTPHLRIGQILGVEIANRLIHCSGEKDSMSFDLYISHPRDAKARPRFQNLYVNLRRVDNDSVTYSIREAFSRFIMSKLKATWFCFLEVDPAQIDINIHPRKKTVKFEKEKELFSFFFDTIHTSISKKVGQINTPFSNSREYDKTLHEKENFSSVEENNNTYRKYESPHYIKEDSQQLELSFLSIFDDKDKTGDEGETPKKEAVSFSGEYWDLISCFQIHKRYIMALIKKGIIIIDQHAAHERILYEEALADIKRGRSESQRLLFPITFSMNIVEKDIVLSLRDYFTSLGFDIQDFGGDTVAVSAMPATGFIKSTQIEDAVREMVQSLMEEKDKNILASQEKRFAASYACGAAIKFGKELKHKEMNTLLNGLFATNNPFICPHGRPTFIRISLDELASRFLR